MHSKYCSESVLLEISNLKRVTGPQRNTTKSQNESLSGNNPCSTWVKPLPLIVYIDYADVSKLDMNGYI